jgi:very-short-patch-repair endonuclease
MDLYRDARLFPATLRGRNIVASAADLVSGGVTERAVRWRSTNGRINRVHRGAYLLGPDLPDLLDRIRAALLVAPAQAVVGYHTAAALFGFGIVSSPDIHLVVPMGGPVPRRPGIEVHESAHPVDKPVSMLGVPCTPAARCVIDLARALCRPDALSTVDAALAAAACTADDLVEELTLHRGLRGVRQAREVIAIADPRAECRQESHLRLILHDGGIVMVPQYHVGDEYGFVNYYLDLADPVRRVGVEYDGASHLDRERLRHDRERHNWLEGNGWRMRYFTDRDLYRRPDAIVRIVRTA